MISATVVMNFKVSRRKVLASSEKAKALLR
jgi:hypothetical protein